MPRYRIERDDVLRKGEIDALLRECETNAVDGKKTIMKEGLLFPLRFSSAKMQCLIALMWLFGKRIRETLRIKREDIYWDDVYLYVNFTVQKKGSREATLTPRRALKRMSLDNPYCRYVLEHVSTVRDGWIFKGAKGKRERVIHRKDKETNEVLDTYLYVDEDRGRMTQQYATLILKALNENVCYHLFRHSLATHMAEREATEEELMNWFDWDRYETAHGYVRGGTRLTEKWSNRMW